MLSERVGALGLAPRRAAQATIKMRFGFLQGKERQRRRCRVPLLHLIRCLDRRRVVAGEEARLELSHPVKTFQKDARRLTRAAVLEEAFREGTSIEGTELCGLSAKSPRERDRRGQSVEEESIPLNELQCILGFAFDLVERVALCKKNGNETAGSECRICRVAVIFSHLESATGRFDALAERSCPRNHNREAHIGPCSKVGQSATFG